MATIKQKKAVARIVENRGNVSKSMLEAGYDPITAKNPKNLTESKGYKEEAEPILNQMKKERQRLLREMRVRNLDKVQYSDITRAMDTLTKNIQLLGGEATENTKMTISWEQ